MRFKRSEKMKSIRKALEEGKCLHVAIHEAGIKSRQTIQNWRTERPMIGRYFTKIMEQGDHVRVNNVIDSLYKHALAGNPTCMIFFLKNKAGWKDSPLFNNHSVNIVYGHRPANSPVRVEERDAKSA